MNKIIWNFITVVLIVFMVYGFVWYATTHNLPEAEVTIPGRFELVYEQKYHDNEKTIRYFILVDKETKVKYLYVWSYKSVGLTKLEEPDFGCSS